MAAATDHNDSRSTNPTASTTAANAPAPAQPAPPEGGESELQRNAKRHLWMHFTRMGSYAHAEVPVIVRGEGCYVYDEHGKRYLDGLSALYCVNHGHRADTPAHALRTADARRCARAQHQLLPLG